MLEKVLIAVIVVNYRTPNLVMDAVNSLFPDLAGVDSQLIIVDNCSGDNSFQLIYDWIEKCKYSNRLKLLQTPENLGFAGGNNYGINAIDADYYLLLNSDTIVRKNAISQLMDVAIRCSDVGIFSPRLEWKDGTSQESCFRFHHPLSEIIRSACTGIVDHLLKRYVVSLPVCDAISSPEWTSFACVLIRKQVLVDIGLMDDDFFMYYEDSEFCFRAKKTGWKIFNVPEAKVIHLRGGSSNVKSSAAVRKRLPKYYYESRTKYYYKCFGRGGLLFANICWMLGRSISLFREVIGNKPPHICDKEGLDIWTNFFNPNRRSVMRKDMK